MTSLADHQSSDFVKIMYIGDSKSGKTGSLVSLVDAGYKLRILDMDNGLDILKQYVAHQCPDKLKGDWVEYETIRDKYKATSQGPMVSGSPKAYVEATKLMTTWSDGTTPSEWGKDYILVIDSFDSLCKAAWEWARGMAPMAKDPRQWFYQAQQSAEKVLAMLTAAAMETNVIVISHITYKELQDGSTKGYAAAIGKALGPVIPAYFNTLILAETLGSGKTAKRKIRTVSTPTIDLGTPAPFKIEDSLPLESGLVTLFEKLKTI